MRALEPDRSTGAISPPPSASLWLAVASLWRREVVRFLRQQSRIVGALGTPLVFWLVIGSGLRRSFLPADGGSAADYLEYVYPGTLVMIVLFTAIFANISVIEDRREGFLQAVLAAPVSRLAIVLGKILGSATLAIFQSLLFLLLAPLTGISLTLPAALVTAVTLVLLSLMLSALGFLVAWPLNSTQGFHAVMNLLLMPLWLLSGALFPAGGASAWIALLMSINPLTYGVAALRHALYFGALADPALPSPALAFGVTMLTTVVLVACCVRIVESRS